MRKLFINEVRGDKITLTGDEHKHLSKVLRAEIGGNVTVCDRLGNNYECIIERINRDETLLKIHNASADVVEPSIKCDLFFGVLKGSSNESTVRHAVELGVHRLIPFLSEFTVAQDTRSERLNKIALEASKQCGRSIVPQVENPITFDALIKETHSYDLVVFLYEKAQANLKDFLRSYFVDKNEVKSNNENSVDGNDNGSNCRKSKSIVDDSGGIINVRNDNGNDDSNGRSNNCNGDNNKNKADIDNNNDGECKKGSSRGDGNDGGNFVWKNIAVIIGAEGGFSSSEANLLINQGVTPLSMGARILKADTAAITALSCVMYESGNLK